MKKTYYFILLSFIIGCANPSYIRKEMDILSIWLPKHKWMIMFNGKDVKTIQENSSPSGDSGYFLFSNNAFNYTFSFYIEPAPSGATSAKDCRDIAWKRMAPNLKLQEATNMKTSDTDEIYSYEYIIPKSRGYPINQKHWNVHYYRNGYWIDFHISKMNYTESDEEIISKFINKVLITN